MLMEVAMEVAMAIKSDILTAISKLNPKFVNQSLVAVFHIKSRGSVMANCCRSHARSIRAEKNQS